MSGDKKNCVLHIFGEETEVDVLKTIIDNPEVSALCLALYLFALRISDLESSVRLDRNIMQRFKCTLEADLRMGIVEMERHRLLNYTDTPAPGEPAFMLFYDPKDNHTPTLGNYKAYCRTR